MLRMVIANSNEEDAQWLFQIVKEWICKEKVKCELYSTKDMSSIYKIVQKDAGKFDVFILNANDKLCAPFMQMLRKRNLIPAIILTSREAYDVKRVLNFRPTALITQWDNPSQLERVLQYVHNEQVETKQYFTIKNKDAVIRVDYEEIQYMESQQRIVILHTSDQDIKFYAKLNDLIRMLPAQRFVRCHQSYIVNLGAVRTLDKANRTLELKNGKQIEISKRYYPQVIEVFNRNY